MSYIANPDVTTPPGELMYRKISFFGSSDSKNKNWAHMTLATASLTSPVKKIILSYNNLEKISYERSPLLVCSTTIGIKELI